MDAVIQPDEAVRAVSVLDSISDAVASVDRDWRFTYVNRCAEIMARLSAQEILGNILWDLFPNVLTPENRRHLHYAMQERVKAQFEEYYAPDDRWIEVAVFPTPDGLVLLVRDISVWKQQEIAFCALTAELDRQKLVRSVTDLAIRLTGAESGGFFQTPNEASAHLSIPHDVTVLERAFRGQEAVRADGYLAAAVVSRSGEALGAIVLAHSLPGYFTDAHESAVARLAAQAAIAMDNARQFEQTQWVQSELKRSNEELRRANKDLETFAYSASHDLQEPLRNIALSAQLLERSGEIRPSSDAAAFLHGIREGARRMEHLVQALLDYTRATRYGEGPPPDVDAQAVLSAVCDNLKALIEEHSAKIIVSDVPVVAMHGFHLAQLFQNLIGNALKYCRPVPPVVRVSAKRQQGWWVFSVADNGIGIDPRYAIQIFGLFKRLHSRDEYPGSGIGLSICQRIVEQYGGRIWLEKSEPGAGALFCFSVPER